jgi:hypothetical protein
MRARLREEQVESLRDHRSQLRVDQHAVVIIRVREHDRLEVAGSLALVVNARGINDEVLEPPGQEERMQPEAVPPGLVLPRQPIFV